LFCLAYSLSLQKQKDAVINLILIFNNAADLARSLSFNRWMLSFRSILNESGKSSIEALHYCKMIWCLVKGCGVWLTFVVFCQGLRCLVKDFLNDFNIILQ